MYCEIKDNQFRPYIPASLRRDILKTYHGLSHPSTRVMDRMIRRQYIWPNLMRDVASYCRTCLACQTSKISRHNKPLPSHFSVPDARFQHVHIDIVGPLLPSNGYRYLLTMIDRYSRWPEAIPIPDMTAETVAQEFYKNWVSHYGAPAILTTDQGQQFESGLLNEIMKLLGIKRIHTTSYYPAANGMVERWHRDLKAALMCTASETDWYFKFALCVAWLAHSSSFRRKRESSRNAVRAAPPHTR